MLRKLLFWGCAVVFPLPLLFTFDALPTDPEQVKLYIFLGITAYAWWLLSILLSVRPSWLDRFVGLPSIYGLHGILGVLAIGAAYIHRENTYSPSLLARDLGDWSFYGALAVLLFSVFLMSGWLVDRSRLLLKAKSSWRSSSAAGFPCGYIDSTLSSWRRSTPSRWLRWRGICWPRTRCRRRWMRSRPRR